MVAEIILMPRQDTREQAKQCAQYLGRALDAVGVKVREQVSLCSGKAELQKAIATALGRSNVVAVLGGAGPEDGFVSRQVLSQGLRLPLERDEGCLAAIRAYCEKTGEPFTPEDEERAKIPQGAVTFPGSYGKTPGIAVSSQKQHILLLPENQQETAALFAAHIGPYLSGGEAQTTVNHTVRTYGINEEHVRAQLCELLDEANPAVTLEKDGEEVLIRVSAHGVTAQAAAALCSGVLREIVERVGDAAYGLNVDSLQSAVVGKLTKKQLDLAVAESGTGGIVTRVLMETAGGADALRYTVNVDTDEAKTAKLGLEPKLLAKQGGVSEQAAVRMAHGARKKADTALGVAVTLDTGAGGSGKKEPDGLVYIAVCDANNVYVKKLVVGASQRARDAAVDAALSRALNMVRLFVDYLPGAYSGAIPLGEALAGRTVTDKESYTGNDGPGGQRKQGFLSRLAGNFIIRKADEPSVKVRKIIFILAVLVFLGSGAYVGNYYWEAYSNAKKTGELSEVYTYGEMGEVEVSDDYPRSYLTQFAGLWNINPDVIGYLRIDDTIIDYPVVWREDDTSNSNAYYLRRDFYGESNQNGIPFLDYRADPALPSDNLVIYGHNMKNGQMFSDLVNYRKLDYYKEHPVINFSTVYREDKYKIISIFITNSLTYVGDYSDVFGYHNFIDAQDDADFLEFVNQVRIRSEINTPVDVQAGDHLITLSTCTYEFKEARLVVVARRVRDGEDATVDVDRAEMNPLPLYPDIWYKTFGGTKPNVETASVVTQAVTNTPSSSAPQVTPTPSAPAGSGSSGSSQAGSESSEEEASSSSQAQESSQSSSQPPDNSEFNLFDGVEDFSSSQPAESQPEPPPADPGDGDRGPDDLVFPVSARDGRATFNASLHKPLASVQRVSSGGSIFDGLDIDPPKGKTFTTDEGGKQKDASGFFHDGGGSSSGSSGQPAKGTLVVYAGGQQVSGSAQEIVSRIVQQEIGSYFHEEAIKAQAVAAYSYVVYHNNKGQAPAVFLASASSVGTKVEQTVAQVLGEAVYYNGSVALAAYHATSAGKTTSSEAVWGGSIPYLVSVDSSIDSKATHYKVERVYTSDAVSRILWDKLSIETDGNPAGWFEILGYNDGIYVNEMVICGHTKSPNTGNTLSGRLFRESVMDLRSACFEIEYDDENDLFHFITYGYGHGVGMSQNGANFYAQQGWTYRQILEHYYPGCTVS